MSVATQVNHHCPFYGRKCYQCGYWNPRGNKFVIENVDSRGFVEVYDEGTCNFKEVFENRTFADGLQFGVKIEE